MKSKILILALALVMTVSALASCGYVTIPEAAADEITLVTVDADAKVEFVVNPNNKVVAATPLNDLAAIVIFEEELTGKAPDEAVAQFISLLAKIGLIKDGSVKLSVTGDSEYSKAITEFIIKEAKKSMKKEGIEGNIEIVPPISEEELRTICLEKKYIYEEDAYKYLYKDLIYTLAARRVGYDEFPSAEIIYLYEIFDETNYNIVVKGETLADVETLKDSFPDTYIAYKSAVDSYKSLSEEVRSFLISYYFDKDSQYQKSLSALRDAREAMLNGSGSAEAFKNAEYDLLNNADVVARAETELYRKKLDVAYAAIEEIEKSFENQSDLEVHLRQTYQERLSRVKKAFEKVNEEFKSLYKTEIDSVSAELKVRKQNIVK